MNAGNSPGLSTIDDSQGSAKVGTLTASRGHSIAVVVPTLNARHHLSETVPPLLIAGRRHGPVVFVFADNGSTDGSHEFFERIAAPDIRVISGPKLTVAALRNVGARAASSTFISFIDADCVIPEDYFDNAVAFMSNDGVSATGCAYELPDAPKWIEATWHDLHFIPRERDVTYINAGNLFVLRSAFEAVGGFKEEMQTGEDAELGARLNAAGHRLRVCPRVSAIHLGNPKTIGQFYKRNVWHGLGMLGTVSRTKLDRPTIMLGAHLVLTGAGLMLLVAAHASLIWGIAGLALLQTVVPAASVLYRMRRTRVMTTRGLLGVFLYWLYYWARSHALFLILSGRANEYRK